MPTYTVNSSQVQNFLLVAGEISAKIKSELDALAGDLRGDLSEWTSDARAAYDIRKQTWDNAAGRLPVTLQNARNSMENISTGYTRADNEGVQLFSGGR
jgi:uncharacterized protein YukE